MAFQFLHLRTVSQRKTSRMSSNYFYSLILFFEDFK